jgi:hypothetical protein
MASTVKDLAILHAAMSGPDASDYVSLTQPAVHLAGFSDIQDLKGLRIGVYSRYFDDADKEIVASCRSALAALEKRGAKIVEIELPYLQVLDRAHKITIMTEFANIIKAHMKNHLTSLGADAQVWLHLVNIWDRIVKMTGRRSFLLLLGAASWQLNMWQLKKSVPSVFKSGRRPSSQWMSSLPLRQPFLPQKTLVAFLMQNQFRG